MNNMELVDISRETKTSDRFMMGVYISLFILVVLAIIVYYFGYDILKPFIKV